MKHSDILASIFPSSHTNHKQISLTFCSVKLFFDSFTLCLTLLGSDGCWACWAIREIADRPLMDKLYSKNIWLGPKTQKDYDTVTFKHVGLYKY